MAGSIREWGIQDVPAVHALLAELARSIGDDYHGDLRLVERHFQESARHPDLYSNWVCEIDGRVAGFLSAVFYSTPMHRKGTALINELVVSEGSRGAGIGKELLDHCVRHAAARGFDEVEVGVEKHNTGALRFYRRNGVQEEYVLLGRELSPAD